VSEEGRQDLGATLRGWALLDPPDGAPQVVVLAEAAGDDDLASALDGSRPRRFAAAWHEGAALGGEVVLVLRMADTGGGTRRVYVLRDPSERLLEVVRFDHRVRLVPLARGEELPTGEELLGRLDDALEIRAFGGPA
jgi:hypothetical protein